MPVQYVQTPSRRTALKQDPIKRVRPAKPLGASPYKGMLADSIAGGLSSAAGIIQAKERADKEKASRASASVKSGASNFRSQSLQYFKREFNANARVGQPNLYSTHLDNMAKDPDKAMEAMAWPGTEEEFLEQLKYNRKNLSSYDNSADQKSLIERVSDGSGHTWFRDSEGGISGQTPYQERLRRELGARGYNNLSSDIKTQGEKLYKFNAVRAALAEVNIGGTNFTDREKLKFINQSDLDASEKKSLKDYMNKEIVKNIQIQNAIGQEHERRIERARQQQVNSDASKLTGTPIRHFRTGEKVRAAARRGTVDKFSRLFGEGPVELELGGKRRMYSTLDKRQAANVLMDSPALTYREREAMRHKVQQWEQDIINSTIGRKASKNVAGLEVPGYVPTDSFGWEISAGIYDAMAEQDPAWGKAPPEIRAAEVQKRIKLAFGISAFGDKHLDMFRDLGYHAGQIINSVVNAEQTHQQSKQNLKSVISHRLDLKIPIQQSTLDAYQTISFGGTGVGKERPSTTTNNSASWADRMRNFFGTGGSDGKEAK